MTNRQWQLFLLIAVLSLGRAASAALSIYRVKGTYKSIYDGGYVENRQPELHYKRLGEADSKGNYRFLYTDSRRPNTWILGWGKTLSTAEAWFRAPAVEGRPPATGWSWVWGYWSREGKEVGDPRPKIRVVGVGETNITSEEFERQLEGGEEIVSEKYIICNSTNETRLIISKNSDDPFYCDGVQHCESGADELCSTLPVCDFEEEGVEDDHVGILCKSPKVTIIEESRRAEITRKRWEAGSDSVDDQGNIVCKSHENIWVIISENDPRFCNGSPDCKSRSDELCPYVTVSDRSKSANISRDLWEAGSDSIGDQGNIVCKNDEDKWLIFGENDPRFCDGLPDCRSRSDELCPYVTVSDRSKSANISRELWEAGSDSIGDQGNIVCKNDEDKWLIFGENDPRFCDGLPDCKSESDELCPYVTFRDMSKRANITRELWESESDREDDQGNLVCITMEGSWAIIDVQDPRFCDGVSHCKSELDERCSYVAIWDNSKSANISRELWKADLDDSDNQSNAICKIDLNWEIISPRDLRFCDGVPDCRSGHDELCPYVTIRDNLKSANITRELYEKGADSEDEEGNVVCRSSSNKTWIILGFENCERCNNIKDCATGFDELGCPVYVSPSFELPIYCCLVVLILGVLLRLGWQAVTTAATKESLEMENVMAKANQLKEAVDLLVEAALTADQLFPEASYEVLHDQCGGLDLLIGTRHGKCSLVFCRHYDRRNQSSQYSSQL